MYPRTVSRQEFDTACDAVWTEIEYVNNLDRRTSDEAKSVPAFSTLARRYLRLMDDSWADQPNDPSTGQVEDAVHGLRKVAGIMIRAMIYCGIRAR